MEDSLAGVVPLTDADMATMETEDGAECRYVHQLKPPTYEDLLHQVQSLHKALAERDEAQFSAEHESDMAESRRAHALNSALVLAAQEDRPWEPEEVVRAARAFADFLSGAPDPATLNQAN